MSRPALVLIRALILALAVLSPGLAQAQPKAPQPKVVIYVTNWCPYCKKAMAYFQAKGIPFTAQDIETDPAAAQRFQQFGARGVPLVVINGKPIAGYSVEEYDKALGQ